MYKGRGMHFLEVDILGYSGTVPNPAGIMRIIIDYKDDDNYTYGEANWTNQTAKLMHRSGGVDTQYGRTIEQIASLFTDSSARLRIARAEDKVTFYINSGRDGVVLWKEAIPHNNGNKIGLEFVLADGMVADGLTWTINGEERSQIDEIDGELCESIPGCVQCSHEETVPAVMKVVVGGTAPTAGICNTADCAAILGTYYMDLDLIFRLVQNESLCKYARAQMIEMPALPVGCQDIGATFVRRGPADTVSGDYEHHITIDTATYILELTSQEPPCAFHDEVFVFSNDLGVGMCTWTSATTVRVSYG
jgi:hypothetical protein